MKNEELQAYLQSATQKMRDNSFANSPQLTLGELLALLKDIPTEWGSHNDPVTIRFDFGTFYPTGFSSWRGSYSEIAINYAPAGYDYFGLKDVMSGHTNLKDFIDWLESSIGGTYTGWKGGDFTMTADTPVWVANDGNADNTGVVGIRNEEYTVYILTAYCEY